MQVFLKAPHEALIVVPTKILFRLLSKPLLRCYESFIKVHYNLPVIAPMCKVWLDRGFARKDT